MFVTAVCFLFLRNGVAFWKKKNRILRSHSRAPRPFSRITLFAGLFHLSGPSYSVALQKVIVKISDISTCSPRGGGALLLGLYGDVPLDRVWFFGLAVLNRVYYLFASVLNRVSCPKQDMVLRTERLLSFLSL